MGEKSFAAQVESNLHQYCAWLFSPTLYLPTVLFRNRPEFLCFRPLSSSDTRWHEVRPGCCQSAENGGIMGWLCYMKRKMRAQMICCEHTPYFILYPSSLSTTFQQLSYMQLCHALAALATIITQKMTPPPPPNPNYITIPKITFELWQSMWVRVEEG